MAFSRRWLGGFERVVLGFLWALLWSSVLALVLAHAGFFRPFLALVFSLVWALAGVAVFFRRLRLEGEGGSGLSVCFLGGWVLILAIAVPIAARGNRYLGGWDTGVYVAAACEMGRSGSLDIMDPLLAELPASERPAFMHEANPMRQAWHAGFLIQNPEEGRLRPEFYHLYPAWLAMWSWGGGVEGVWFAHTLLALAALGMTVIAGASFFGGRAAFLGGIALLGCAAQLFAMRSTTAEMMTQFFLFGGFWAMGQALSDPRGAVGLLISGAAAFGAAILCHGTAYLPVGLVLLFLVGYGVWGKRPGRWKPLWILLMVGGGAVLWNAVRAGTVTSILVRLTFQHPGWWLSGILLSGATGFVILYLLRKGAGAWRGGGGELAFLFAVVMLVGVWGLGLGRPGWDSGPEAWNVRIFTRLTGFLGIPFALVFLALTCPWQWPIGRLLLLFAGVGTTGVLLVNKMAKPFYLWGARRWVELPLPFVLLMAAAGLVWAYDRTGWKPKAWVGRLAVLALGGFWLLSLFRDGRWVIAAREYVGTHDRLKAAAQQLEGAGAILCDHWDSALVWRYVYGLPAWGLSRLETHHGPSDAATATRLMRRWVEEGKRVYWAGPWFADPILRLAWIGTFETEDQRLEERPDRLPARVFAERRRTVLYRVGLEGGEEAELVVFGHSALGLVEGFSGLRLDWDEDGQRLPHRRILRGRGVFFAPRVGGTWALRLSHQHPSRETLTTELWGDGQRLAVWEVERAWRDYPFEMPSGGGAVRMELRSPTFKAGNTRVGVSVARLYRIEDGDQRQASSADRSR